MDDKELLERAAKSAGYEIDVTFLPEASGMWWIQLVVERRRVWNPLADDGDAMRLAVKIHMFDGSLFALFMKLRLEEVRLNCSRSDEEIARRAIVRTAAHTYTGE